MLQKRSLIIALIVVLIIVIILVVIGRPTSRWKKFWKDGFSNVLERVYSNALTPYSSQYRFVQNVEQKRDRTATESATAANLLTRNILQQNDNHSAEDLKQVHDRARTYYVEALTEIKNNFQPTQPLHVHHAAMFTTDEALLFALGFDTFDIDTDLVTFASATKEDMINNIKEAIHNQTEVPSQRSDALANVVIKHTSDSENVHDHAVNGYLRSIVNRLKEDQAGENLPSLESISDYFTKNGALFSENRPERVSSVLEVIEATKRGEINTAYGISDGEALMRVMARARHPRNSQARQLLEQSVFDNLFDAKKQNGTYCVGGRTGRILGALSTLDFDKRNWDISTLEEIKNEIFQKVRKLITEYATKASQSSDPKISTLGKRHLVLTKNELDALGAVDAKDEETFDNEIRKEISKMVDAEIVTINSRADGVLTPKIIEEIKTEAIAIV